MRDKHRLRNLFENSSVRFFEFFYAIHRLDYNCQTVVKITVVLSEPIRYAVRV